MPRYNIEASIRDALHELRLVRNCLEGQIERLDRLELELAALLGGSAAGGGMRFAPGPSQVAHNLEIRQRPDGSAVIAIDNGRKFTLARQLAEVFQFIASGGKDPSGKDSLVAWRSRSEILDFLADSGGKSFQPRYINNLIHRLKCALRKAGYDCNLIQSHRRKGVRFAFKRNARALPDALFGG